MAKILICKKQAAVVNEEEKEEEEEVEYNKALQITNKKHNFTKEMQKDNNFNKAK